MRGRSVGEVVIEATAGPTSGSTVVTVSSLTVSDVELSPQEAETTIGDTVRISATVRDTSSTELDSSVSWSSSDTDVATVDGSGVVTGVAEGSVDVVGNAGGVADTSRVVVQVSQSAPSSPSSLSVTEGYRTDSSVTYDATWSASDGADAYSWKAGSNTGAWTRNGTVQTTSATFSAPRSTNSDSSYFCVAAENEAGVSDNQCTGFVVPQKSSSGAIASVEVTPSSAQVNVGKSVLFSATARDSSGEVVPASFTWSSLNTPVASVDGSGRVTGQAEGTARITATADGVPDTATVEVVASGSDVAPFLVEDFSTYSSTSDMLSDPRGIYVGSSDIREDLIVLDTAEGVPELGTSQSMRYDFEPGVGTISRALDLDGLNELWIEVWVKFSSNFKTDWGGSGNPDYKWIFVNTVTSRFDTKTGTFGTNYRIAGPRNANVDDSGTSSQEWDGEWHRYRVHYKHASATGANDGTVEAWIANEPGGRNLWIGSVGDVDTNIGEDGVGLMQMFHLGRNMNQPPTELVNIWWGKISLWDQDPGW